MPKQQRLNQDPHCAADLWQGLVGWWPSLGRPWGRWLVLGALAMGLGAIAGCGGSSDTAAPPAATSSPEAMLQTPTPGESPAATPEAATPAPPAPAPTPAATPAPEAAPQTVASAGETLPQALVKEWQPDSAVLFEFGKMTVTPDQVEWSSGQSSPYTVISSTEGGYLLKLSAAPSFFDTPHPYIKLIPKTDANGAVTSVEVAFYENEAAAKSDQYVMFGSYFTQ